MFRESQKVFMACAIGAGIGSFVALEISVMFCWVGFLLGSLAGYLCYEWKEVVKAIPKAAKFKFPHGYLKFFVWDIFLWFNVSIVATVLLVCILKTNPSNSEHLSFRFAIFTGGCIWFLSVFLSSIPVLNGAYYKMKSPVSYNGEQLLKDEIATIKFFALCTFLPFLFFWHLPHGIIFVARRFPKFAKWFVAGCCLVAREWYQFWKKFFWKLFLMIHSEMRILCGIDAMIGAMIGYFVGSALIGALAGGLVGVFNYLVVTELCLKRFGYIPIKN